MSDGKPIGVPSGITHVSIPMTKERATRFAWVAFVLGAVAIVANSLTGAGFLPPLGMQICGWLAGVCTGLSWYFARKTPDFDAYEAIRKSKEGGTKKTTLVYGKTPTIPPTGEVKK